MTRTRERILSFGPFRFVPFRQQLFDGDRLVHIGSRELGLLQVLLEDPGEVVTKKRLIEAVWSGVWVDEANLRANIGALRRALGDHRRFDGRKPGRPSRRACRDYQTKALRYLRGCEYAMRRRAQHGEVTIRHV